MRFGLPQLSDFLLRLPQKSAIAAVLIYQKTLSPDHGFLRVIFPDGFCKYKPSCSEYMRQALEKYGFVRGSLKGIFRLIRCNPCATGGFNPA